MRSKTHLSLLLLLALSARILVAAPLGTAFTYQGKPTDGGPAADGIYDFRFAVYDSAAKGVPISGVLTNAATPVTDGLFTVTLDFGPGVFLSEER